MAEVLDVHQQWLDKNTGSFLVGGLVYYGKPNTDPTILANQIDVWADRAETIALPNPQTIGSDGRVENKPWISQRYSIQVDDALDVLNYSYPDNGENISTGTIIALSNVQGIDDITAESPAGITEYEDQQVFTMRPVATNTGNMTIDIDQIGAISLLINGEEIPVGGILADLNIEFSYNSQEDQFDLLSPISSASPGPIGETNANTIKGTTINGATIKASTEFDGPLGVTTANTAKVSTLNASTSMQIGSGQVITTLGDPGTLDTSDVKIPTNNTVKEYVDSTEKGRVLQVISDNKTDTQSTTAGDNAYTAISGLTVTITPAANGSKILLSGFVSICNASVGVPAVIRLKRDGAVIGGGASASMRTICHSANPQARGESPGSFPLHFLDDPGTTLAVVYTVEATGLSNGDFFINRGATDTDNASNTRSNSVITAQEIKG